MKPCGSSWRLLFVSTRFSFRLLTRWRPRGRPPRPEVRKAAPGGHPEARRGGRTRRAVGQRAGRGHAPVDRTSSTAPDREVHRSRRPVQLPHEPVAVHHVGGAADPAAGVPLGSECQRPDGLRGRPTRAARSSSLSSPRCSRPRSEGGLEQFAGIAAPVPACAQRLRGPRRCLPGEDRPGDRARADTMRATLPPAAGSQPDRPPLGPLRAGAAPSRDVTVHGSHSRSPCGCSWSATVRDPLDLGPRAARTGSATTGTTSTEALLGLGRITALLAGYLALIEVLLLARLPFLERIVGFDRLTFWHRWNGHAVLDLVLAHVVFSVWGYAKIGQQLLVPGVLELADAPPDGSRGAARRPGRSALKPGGSLEHHARSTAGDLSVPGHHHGDGRHRSLLVVVLVTSLVVVRRKLSYEWWYAVHFTAYAGIALAWFHMIPDGNDLARRPGQRPTTGAPRTRWRSRSSSGTGSPGRSSEHFRYDLRVTEVIEEGPGRRLAADQRPRPRAAAARRRASSSSGASSRRASGTRSIRSRSRRRPTGDSFRITVKNLGDHTREVRRRSRSARACSPRARSASSPTRAARATRRC